MSMTIVNGDEQYLCLSFVNWLPSFAKKSSEICIFPANASVFLTAFATVCFDPFKMVTGFRCYFLTMFIYTPYIFNVPKIRYITSDCVFFSPTACRYRNVVCDSTMNAHFPNALLKMDAACEGGTAIQPPNTRCILDFYMCYK